MANLTLKYNNELEALASSDGAVTVKYDNVDDGFVVNGLASGGGGGGTQGPPGQAATIQVGTVTTLAPGSNATVTNVGTSNAARFNFGIPAGADGQNGTNGRDGVNGQNGTNGTNGKDGEPGADGQDGQDGKSAFQLAQDAGFVGTQAQWLASLKGADGHNGNDGVDGVDGKSAYEIAVDNGFVGTESEWLESLKGADGQDGSGGGGDSYNDTEIRGLISAEATARGNADAALQTAINGKQDVLIAGTNIQIAGDGKTISATDTVNETYSTAEVDTGKTWINGKPIYRQVFTGNIVAAANTRASITLPVSGVSALVDYGGEWNPGASSTGYVVGDYDSRSLKSHIIER